MIEPGKRRGPLQIIFYILKNAVVPIKKTRLCTAARLNESILVKYMSLLLDRGLVKKVPHIWEVGHTRGQMIDVRTPYLFVVTEKGKALTRHFRQIYNILDWEEK